MRLECERGHGALERSIQRENLRHVVIGVEREDGLESREELSRSLGSCGHRIVVEGGFEFRGRDSTEARKAGGLLAGAETGSRGILFLG